jgi:hypothetical protein
LMQMGRWFGFRPGYRDLVRVFLGVNEGKKGDTDLVSLFKDVCRMEERFREEIKRYLRKSGAERITPKEIPPLIAISGTLPPTAKNKMFNAVLRNKNFGGQRSMLTLTAAEPTGIDRNIATTKRLLAAASLIGTMSLGKAVRSIKKKDTLVEVNAVVLSTTNDYTIKFLEDFRWLESDYKHPKRPADTNLQIDFLRNAKHGINGWLIIAPQRKTSFGEPLKFDGLGDLTVKERFRNAGRGFQVFGEPTHRTIAEYLAGIEPGSSAVPMPNTETARLRDEHRGVILLYPVRSNKPDKVSIGFELIFPNNDIAFDMNFTVRRKAESAQVIVPTSDDDE